ncbi:MAG: NAD-dependent epimerase/dehydratase family protein [Chloroflexota bacterium]|nr:NAD-dependent epimerase/dehydratase family protein [Chloroflexota bacterium]
MVEVLGVKHFVTGGAGFIGSHLTAWLLQNGRDVTVYDNLSMGRKAFIEHNLGNPRFCFVEGDLLNYKLLEEQMAGHDFVWHLGANGDIAKGVSNPDLDLNNGIIATQNVMKAMKANGIKRLVYTSSSTVYGDIKLYPTPETAAPLFPESFYGASKLAGEAIISAWCHLFDMQAWVFRFGNVVGARMRRGVIHDFIAKLRKNPNELEILGDGMGHKNFFLVEDCIEGMLTAVNRADVQPCDVFNLGCESTTKISAIARIVAEEMGLKNVRFRTTGGKRGWPGDVPNVIYDVSKMKSLGWQAKHTSDEAVRIAARRLLGEE